MNAVFPNISQRSAITLVGCLLFAISLAPLQSGEIVADSGFQRVAVIELFTSEGCSSCPPAEAWLNSLVSSKGLWRDFVPLAFHVDYWDNLGWKDPFASADHTARQKNYAEIWKAKNIYTPEFVLDGREWLSSTGQRPVPVAGTSSHGRLQIESLADDQYRTTFESSEDFNALNVQVAILGFDRPSKITSGENAGRNPTHHFVVLSQKQVPLKKESGSNIWTATASLAGSGEGRLALAAWVSAANSPAPLQGAGGWLKP